MTLKRDFDVLPILKSKISFNIWQLFQILRTKVKSVRPLSFGFDSSSECIDSGDKEFEKLKSVGFQDWSEYNCITYHSNLFLPNCVFLKWPNVNWTKMATSKSEDEFLIKMVQPGINEISVDQK